MISHLAQVNEQQYAASFKKGGKAGFPERDVYMNVVVARSCQGYGSGTHAAAGPCPALLCRAQVQASHEEGARRKWAAHRKAAFCATMGIKHHAGPQGVTVKAAAHHLQDAACCTLSCSVASNPRSKLAIMSQTQQGRLTPAGDSKNRSRGRTGSTARPCAGVLSGSTATAAWRPAQRDHPECCRHDGATWPCLFLKGGSRCTGSTRHGTASWPQLCRQQP